MDSTVLEKSRRQLRGLAELILAGPQYATCGDIRLRSAADGFGIVTAPDVRIEGVVLVAPTGRFALTGTISQLAAAAGVVPRRLTDVYSDASDVSLDEVLDIEPAVARRLADAFAIGNAALRSFAPGEVPVLWPEHFDIAITVGGVNYGVSAGDSAIPAPYAYVGPWQPHTGEFWNVPFGAARTLDELGDTDAVLEFFRAGADRVASDTPQ